MLFQDEDFGLLLPSDAICSTEILSGVQIQHIQFEDAGLIWAPNFFSKEQSKQHLEYLLANESALSINQVLELDPAQVVWKHIKWKHEAIMMFSKPVLQPRYTAWHGDTGKSYRYSGVTMQPQAWNDGLLNIKAAIEPLAQQTFNSVLLNLYRNGHDHMGWHSDNEPELGRDPIIASVNFGSSRKFKFRRKRDHKHQFDLTLSNGALLIMKGAIQHHWQHQLPKQLKNNELRINLTFRHIV